MKRPRVFLVEDEPIIASGIERKILQLGYEVAGTVSTGEAAIKAIPLIVTLAIIGIIYGALVAMVQKDVKKLIAGPTVYICDECVDICLDII